MFLALFFLTTRARAVRHVRSVWLRDAPRKLAVRMMPGTRRNEPRSVLSLVPALVVNAPPPPLSFHHLNSTPPALVGLVSNLP